MILLKLSILLIAFALGTKLEEDYKMSYLLAK